MKNLLRRGLVLLIRLLGVAGANGALKQTYQSNLTRPHILLIRPDQIGDLVLTTPVLRALKTTAPEAHLTMMVGPWASEVVERHTDIDRLLICPFPGVRSRVLQSLKFYCSLISIIRELRRGNYDLAIHLRPHFWWSAALIYLAGIPRRIGYAGELTTPFLTSALPFQEHVHSTVSCLRIVSTGLEILGYPSLPEPYTPERYPLYFEPSEQEQVWVSQRLHEEGIDPATPIIVIHPGTSIAVKLWRPEAWANCATILARACPGRTPPRIILTGSTNERSLVEAIAHGTSTCTTLVTDATLGQLAALLQRAQLVLGVDSGPLHLAVAQGTPTVSIFGPTDPHFFGPWGSREQHAIVVSDYRCPTCPVIPCGRLDLSPRELPLHPCVRQVSEQQVLGAVSQVCSLAISVNPRERASIQKQRV